MKHSSDNNTWTWEPSPKKEFIRRRLERCYNKESYVVPSKKVLFPFKFVFFVLIGSLVLGTVRSMAPQNVDVEPNERIEYNMEVIQ